MPTRPLLELARLVEGRIVSGEPGDIHDANSLTNAGPGEITYAVDEKNLRRVKDSRAGACLIQEKFTTHPELQGVTPVLVAVADPLDAFLKILAEYRPQPSRPELGISPAAHVDPTARVGKQTNIHPGAVLSAGVVVGDRCEIHPGVVLGAGARVGNDCVLHPHVVLYAGVEIQDRVIIHAGAVLGADGFGYRFRGGRFEKIPQLGTVLVDSDVEIGHNCQLGRHNVFASQVGLAGSVTTGDYVRLAGQVGVADHIEIGQGATVGAKAGVLRNIPAGETQVGIPARPEKEEFRIVMATSRTPEMRQTLRAVEERLQRVEQQLASPPGAGS
jgi:UDP-3-O-[3-hydroxymyristoyl] glucosamine N-acyltransferase